MTGSAALASAPAAAAAAGNIERIVRVLNCFGPDNAPLASGALVAGMGGSRATGYGLLRAMVRQGLLQRVDHGWLRLGPAAQTLGFVPLAAGYGERFSATTVAGLPARGRTAADPLGHEVAWNQHLVEIVDHSEFASPGPWRIAFANASLSNPWREALLRSLRYGVRVNGDMVSDLVIETADDDWRRQLGQIERLLADRPAALIVSAAPGDDGQLSDLLMHAIRDGTVVVAVDRRPREVDATLAFVSASGAVIGRTSALWLAERLAGRGRVWMLSGVQGASPAIRRQGSALEVFSDFPGIAIEAVTHTGWTGEGGYRAIEDLLDDIGTPPDAVWCDSGLQGVGAVEAFLARGLTPPMHTGGDLNRMYKLAIQHRIDFMAVDYPAAMGALAIETALTILRGGQVPRRIETPMQVILPRGQETASVKADAWAERHVRWELPDDAILSQGASLRPSAKTAEHVDARPL